MPFPNLKPTSRSFDAGDYPIKTFQSQSGVETRILYGSRRTGAQLSLSFDNISDTDANAFASTLELAPTGVTQDHQKFQVCALGVAA